MVLVSKGDFIWIEPLAGEGIPVGARVLDQDHGRLKVVDDLGQEQWLSVDRRVRIMHPSSVQGVEDMTKLGDYHESAILRNILVRYREKLIYTYTGSILIAVNPYMDIPIYTAEQIRMYKRKKIGELPPHIFAIADNAYSNMKKHRKNQSVVISGESGAGKTESTKLVLQFLATISGQHSWIEQQVLEANPILEAFGNAKTVRNDNSSRFGKYIDVHFNSVGSIEGARIEKYLLEKSRIVSQSQGERNYHIFYCLLAGLSAEEKKHLELTRPSDYFYLTQGKSFEADGRDDAADLAEIRSAMKVLLFKEPEIGAIFQLLSALLHIGNVKYRGTVVDTIEGVEVSDAANVARIARLLQVSEQTLLSTMTTRTMVTREERVVMRLSSRAAVDARDALAKGIYGRLFDYIVTRINDAIYKPRNDPTHRHSIGVLDIFGFENFETNSFEQLCINYANESLQQFFVQHIFKIEQAEYDREQINWRHIKFVDNQETLEMIAARPMNVFSIIDEESIFPKGTDQSMLSKLHTNHSKGSLYLRPKSDLQRSFGVKHFAGPVFYHTKGFLEKNRDAFSADLHALVQSSKMHLLLRIFDNVDYVESGTISGSIRGKGVTVSGQFRKSLDQLMQQLNHTEPFFIRCIKPNEFKRALMMDRDLVLRQLQYSGMMETIKIRRNGYPIRHDFEPFVRRYRVLVNGIGPLHRIDVRSAAEQICKKVLGSNSEFQLGKTKVFLKEKHDLYLEQEYHRMLAFRATVIQKNVRGWLAKRSFRKKKEAATVIQKHWRRYDQQKRYNQIVAGFCRLQAVLRSRQLVQHYQTLRHNIIQFQAACRGAIVRAKIKELKRKGEERIIEVHEEPKEEEREDIKEEELVGQLFDFLPTDSRPETSTDNESTSSDIIPTTAQANGTIDACDLEKYQFGKFAATYFQSQITATHSKKPLKSPLLSHEDPGTQLAAMAVWITILRFMGDLPDVKHGSNNGEVADKTPVMSRLFETLGRKYSHKDVEEAAHADEFDAVGRTLKKSMGKKLISMTLKRKSKLSAMSSSSSDHSSESTSSSNALMENRPMTSLDKLHYIIGMGILREELRDEIYCQLCKQLTSNPSRLSAARGWILLSLCVGCFAPSERFIKYLYCFIRERGPTGAGYSAYMEERLKRTELNGCRHQPPSYIELQANKSKKPIVLAVTFMDGSVKTLCADSATTADELCTQLAQKVGLKEKFGFSLYIALFDKVSSLGSGSDHVMDAISQCEQYAKEQGRQERNAPWRLFFRKEIFTPWHDSKEDPVSTNLIYQQVVRGIKYGEYRCDKEDDLAALAAQQYFVEEGPLDVNRLESQLHNYLPDFELNGKEMARERWIQSIMYHYRKKFGVNPPSPHHVKEEVVSFAKFKWPLLFSRFYEATKFSGPPLPRNDVIVAVNWTGIYVVDDQEHVLLEFSFPEITRVLHQKGPRPGFDTCTIKTVTGDEYSFQSPNAEDVKILVSTFIDGLKQRSRYVVATKPQRGSDSTNLLDFECGDLLVLLNKTTGKDLLTEKLVKGECARTCLQGLIQTENVYVLPTLVKPNVNTLQLFSKGEQMALDILNNNQVVVIQTNGRPHTLEQFAAANFRAPTRPQSTQRSLMTLRRRDVAPLPRWRYSREPLDVPLLKKLEGRDEQCRDAISMFVYVMKYMGDQPSRRSRLGTDLTDNIFKPAIAHEILRDELYCQLLRQVTMNPSMLSEERGWELVWLATGLFAPSTSLMKEVIQFFKSRPHPVAHDCLARIMKMNKGCSRKFPPHLVEVEAIQHKTTQIFHKVYFPDQSDEAVEVESSTRARDFCHRIAHRLALKKRDGFSLFVKIKEKVLAVPESEFFFDFVRQLSDWIQNNHALKETPIIPVNYQVFFMRKLWMNVKPGDDRNADLIFHYHQECPKYLLGYHKIAKQEAIELAAIILRAITKDSKNAPLAQIPQLLSELVPKDMMKLSSSSEWKKLISSAYVKVEHLTSDQAKIDFLTLIAKKETFGSAFFPVSQYSDLSLPDKLLIAINQNGVHLYDAESKVLITQYPFNVICNWTSGNTYFNMTVGNGIRSSEGKKLLLDTTMGYKMDDLITSYISVLITGQTIRPSSTWKHESVI
ncbi:hypothetical protein Y032_0193g1385 [Ancylostoma ceylanicum]|uniref:Myosin head n=1 Tax=Ancylostoma ceylanicum TaxID=53326 RepID=A0A016SQ77_9BILA|nr:hypothetical protein Y032_0193g1385 [Ancylostoma ceylanicum]